MNAVAVTREQAKVLIVEDERVVATHVERSLEDVGYVVTGIASSAGEAADLVLASPPDVALVDIRLRGRGEGFMIAERLRTENDVPVVYMTAHTDDDTLQRAARTGAYGYVVKPFTIGEVKSALEVALHKHRLDQRQAERERWFATTLRAIGEGVLACDVDQRVTFINAAAEHMLGWTEERARGCLLSELFRRDEPVLAEVVQALNQGRATPLAFEVESALGEALLLEGTVAPIVHADRTLGVVLVLRDVTEQRGREEQLALTDRLSSLGTLVASVAHEINNPLAYTLGNLALAREELEQLQPDLPEPLQEPVGGVLRGLRDAEDGAGRVAGTVKELRAFGRMEERSQRLVDPRGCVDWALRLTSNQLLHHARLVTNLADVPNVRANELKLSQVVVNLLTNAVQALTAERDANQLRVSTWTDDHGWAVIQVEDNGQGMSEEVQRAVFEPFFTTKRGSGTGLGLSICRKIVASFGGTITVESELGRGSRFRVRLPPGNEDLPISERPISTLPPPRASTPAPGPFGRVLIIDDEPMIRTLVSRLLSVRYQVSCAGDVREALAQLNQARRFDVILCDLMMPGESGIDFYAVLRQLYPELVERVAFITGGAVTPDTRKFLETAARPVLSKPFDAQSLSDFVEYARAGGAVKTAAGSEDVARAP